jgi:hypothetical protein
MGCHEPQTLGASHGLRSLFGAKLYASSVANLLFRAQKFADVPFTFMIL